MRPGTPSIEFGPEHQRVEEIVVDPPIDDVDPHGPFRGPHVDDVVAHEEIGGFDELDPELVREEGVLVERRVETARGQQDRRGVPAGRSGRHRAQGGEERVRVVLDGRDPMAGEELREQPHHHLAVLEHVRDPGRRARIVLQDVEGALVHPYDVDAGDVDVDPVGDLEPDHLGTVVKVSEDQVLGDDAGLDALLRAVNVGQEPIERRHPLPQAAFERHPLGRRDDAGDDVEGDQALGRFVVAVDRESDADPSEEEFRLASPRVEDLGWRLVEPALQVHVGGAASGALVAGRSVHLVEQAVLHAGASELSPHTDASFRPSLRPWWHATPNASSALSEPLLASPDC